MLVWHFEDWLKKYFFSILQILETFSLDPLTYVRTQTLAFLATLLHAQPEQEQNLLRLLVNKLVRPYSSMRSPLPHATSLLAFRATPKNPCVRARPITFSKYSRSTRP